MALLRHPATTLALLAAAAMGFAATSWGASAGTTTVRVAEGSEGRYVAHIGGGHVGRTVDIRLDGARIARTTRRRVSFSVALGVGRARSHRLDVMRAHTQRVIASARFSVPPGRRTASPAPQVTPHEQASGHDAPADPVSDPMMVEVDRSAPVRRSQLVLGVTNEQHSLDPWGAPDAIARARSLLDDAVTYQNQHIYGWGAENPEPSPGTYDFASLDRRMQSMRLRRNAIPVITLAGAPDWMTARGTNTSSYDLEQAPTPSHFDDFADLARRIAVRYSRPGLPAPVLHYQVWNEMKGFWSTARNTWDVEAYTDLYNRVYDALKRVNPRIQVGGPYVVIEGTGSARDIGVDEDFATADPISPRIRAVLEYWLQHKHGADFIAIDRGVQDAHDHNSYTTAQKFALLHWFGDVVRAVRTLDGYGDEPIWYSEGFAFADDDPRVQRAAEASAIRETMLAGADVLLKWQDEGTYDLGGATVTGLYSSTLEPGGGVPYPVYNAYRTIHQAFPPGTPLYAIRSSPSGVAVLASDTTTLLINQTPDRRTVRLDGRNVELGEYGLRTVTR